MNCMCRAFKLTNQVATTASAVERRVQFKTCQDQTACGDNVLLGRIEGIDGNLRHRLMLVFVLRTASILRVCLGSVNQSEF